MRDGRESCWEVRARRPVSKEGTDVATKLKQLEPKAFQTSRVKGRGDEECRVPWAENDPARGRLGK